MKYLWTLLILVFDGLIYYRAIGKVSNPFLDNAISIFFIYMILMLILQFIMVVVINRCIIKLKSTEIINKIAKKEERFLIVKSLSLLRFFIHIGFGVIGCWKFFVIGMFYSLFEFILMMYSKKIVTEVK